VGSSTHRLTASGRGRLSCDAGIEDRFRSWCNSQGLAAHADELRAWSDKTSAMYEQHAGQMQSVLKAPGVATPRPPPAASPANAAAAAPIVQDADADAALSLLTRTTDNDGPTLAEQPSVRAPPPADAEVAALVASGGELAAQALLRGADAPSMSAAPSPTSTPSPAPTPSPTPAPAGALAAFAATPLASQPPTRGQLRDSGAPAATPPATPQTGGGGAQAAGGGSQAAADGGPMPTLRTRRAAAGQHPVPLPGTDKR